LWLSPSPVSLAARLSRWAGEPLAASRAGLLSITVSGAVEDE